MKGLVNFAIVRCVLRVAQKPFWVEFEGVFEMRITMIERPVPNGDMSLSRSEISVIGIRKVCPLGSTHYEQMV